MRRETVEEKQNTKEDEGMEKLVLRSGIQDALDLGLGASVRGQGKVSVMQHGG